MKRNRRPPALLLLLALALAGCSGSNGSGSSGAEPVSVDSLTRAKDEPSAVPDPAPEPPASPKPEYVPRCVQVPGLDPTHDGFIQVSQALVETSGEHALQWICREHDWRMRLQNCAGDCESGEWKDVGELRLPELEEDELLVFGLDGCADGSGEPVIGLAVRSRGAYLDHVRRAWAILLVEPFGFREIDPAGVRCQNPDYGL